MRLKLSLMGVLCAAILACGIAPARAQNHSRLRLAEDLTAVAREADARHVPILIAFTEATCPYCARAKRDYLIPLQAGHEYGDKVIIREVDVRKNAKLRDFDGKLTTPMAFARSHAVRLVPTVIVVDSAGKPLVEPIVGLSSADFYQLYLEQAIDTGRTRLRQAAAK